MAGPVILEDVELLRKLAKLIYYQEVDLIKAINFQSEPDLAKFLRDCKSNYDSVLHLMVAGGDLNTKFEKDRIKSPIANDIYSYIVYCANSALQTVRNYTLRMDYLKKIGEHVKSLTKELEEVDPRNVPEVQKLAEEADQSKKVMLEFLRKYRSTASLHYSNLLKDEGLTFDQLVEKHQHIMGLGGLFKNLKDAQKLLVYDSIIAASGRGRVVDTLLKIKGVAGVAVVLITAGMMVWDIFSSAHVVQTATHDVVVSLASAGGAVLGDLIGAALATELLAVEATSVFVMLAGFVTGLAGAFIIGAFAGWLMDLIINSGGSEPPSSANELHCYVTPTMPDGEVLARQIAHKHKLTN